MEQIQNQNFFELNKKYEVSSDVTSINRMIALLSSAEQQYEHLLNNDILKKYEAQKGLVLSLLKIILEKESANTISLETVKHTEVRKTILPQFLEALGVNRNAEFTREDIVQVAQKYLIEFLSQQDPMVRRASSEHPHITPDQAAKALAAAHMLQQQSKHIRATLNPYL